MRALDSSKFVAFTDLHLSPVLFSIGPFDLRWYSLAYFGGIILGYWYLLKLLKQPGAPLARRHADDLVFYAALGSTGVTGAIDYFQGILSVKGGLFNKQKVVEDKLLAVAGLAGAGTIQTFKFLNEVTADKSQPAEVVSAAKLAALRTKRALFGDGKEH